MSTDTCAYCGRVVQTLANGRYRKHLSNQRAIASVKRLPCSGSGRLRPTGEAELARLRKQWRDKDGWLIRTPSSPETPAPGGEAARPEPSRDGDLGGPGRAANFP